MRLHKQVSDFRLPLAISAMSCYNINMKKVELTEVVAALIFRGDKFLICQRPAHKARGLLWEFVGGKVEKGETKAQALVRECREELAVTVAPHDVYMEVIHSYPDIRVHLTIFNTEIAEGEPVLLEHAALKWITPAEIKNYTFCPADKDILKKIADESLKNRQRHNINLGERGEKIAARHLKKKGYKILERNMHTPFGEVDIVAKINDVLIFCEVKTRTSDAYGSPAEAVNKERRMRYIRSAEYYLQKNGTDFTARFDIIEITGGKINHIENAYGR